MEFPAVEKNTSTPSLRFSDTDSTIFIEGESYPENSFEFYDPLLKWVTWYLESASELLLSIQISYMNSSSTKCILDLLDLLDDAHNSGKKTAVEWVYDPENPRSLELAEEFKEELQVSFTLIPRGE